MKALGKKYNSLSSQSGLSLMELMIAIPIGLLVMIGISQVFRASLEGVQIQNKFSRVQENGRIATELIIRDIRGADYWGCVGSVGNITNSTTDNTALPNAGVAGENDVSNKTITAITVKDNTDTLTLNGSNSLPGVKVTTPYMGTASSDINITTGSSLAQGDLVLISDCQNANLFTNTSTTDGVIKHEIGVIAGATPNATSALDSEYGASAQILIPYTKTYFIGENTAGTYSLFISDNGVATELVRNVTDMQVTYGEDSGSDGSANSFNGANTVTNMDSVVSIKIALTAESGVSPSGNSMQRDYEVTANIRNRSLQ